MEELQRPSCIQGSHVYNTVWEVAIGEEWACGREPHNAQEIVIVAFAGFKHTPVYTELYRSLNGQLCGSLSVYINGCL